MLQCHFKSIRLSKFGNAIDENEDNILEPTKSEIETDPLVRFAISDGATESSFAKEWSALLVSAYKDNSFDKEHLHETLKMVAKAWRSKATAIELPWYAQQKSEIGAFATFLGLTINRLESIFETVAIGDCTLFQIRNDELLFTFPVTSIEEFGNTPNLIASNNNYQREIDKAVVYERREIKTGDIILLATDALAAWIFKKKDADEKPWNHLEEILDKNKSYFEDWLNNQRQSNEIKNDDVTFLIIKFE